MVAAGVPVFDLHDDGAVGHGPGDGDDLTDLVDGAGLEGHVGEALGMQAGQQGNRLVELGDAGGDNDAVHRGAGTAGLGQQALSAQVQVPQVAIHEHGVESGRASRLQGRLEAGEVLGQDRGGGLATAGEFGPVAGIGGGGDDSGIDGGGGHAGQHHRRTAGQTGESGVEGEPPVGQAAQTRGEAGPVDGRGGGGAGTVQIVDSAGGARGNDDGAGAGDDGLGQAREHGAGSHINHEAGPGRSEGAGDQSGPIDRIDEDGHSETAGEGGVQTGPLGPGHDLLDGGGEQRGVEGHRGGEELSDGSQDRSPATALLAVVGATTGGRLQGGDDGLQISGAARQNMSLTAVGHPDAETLGSGNASEHGVQDLTGHAAHREHGRGLPHRAQVETPGRASGRGADETGDGMDVNDPFVGGPSAGGGQRLQQSDAEDPLGVADDRGGDRGPGHVDARRGQGRDDSVLGEQDARH